MIPKGWELAGLGDVCQPKTGLQTGPFGSQLHASDYAQNGIPVVMPKDMIKGTISTSTIARISPQKATEVAKHMLQLGDIVFSRRGDLGRFAVAQPENVGWICGTGCMRARLKNSVSPEFIFCQLSTHGSVRWLESNAVGQTMPNLNTEILSELPLRLPPIPEQRKIAAILSTWDRAIELTEKLIAAKQKRKQALIQQLLIGKVRFKEFEGKPWKELKLGKLFKERRESGYMELPLLSITSGEGIVHRDSLDRKDSSNADKSKYLRICPGDIGYNTMRMWQGVSALSEHEGIVSPAYTICTPRSEVDPLFMSYLFKYPPIVHVFWRYSQGMVSDTLNLKFSVFSTIKVQIPARSEQEKIGQVLAKIDTEIKFHTRKVEQLKQQKTGLMQQLLTGKVRVNVDAEMVQG